MSEALSTLDDRSISKSRETAGRQSISHRVTTSFTLVAKSGISSFKNQQLFIEVRNEEIERGEGEGDRQIDRQTERMRKEILFRGERFDYIIHIAVASRRHPPQTCQNCLTYARSRLNNQFDDADWLLVYAAFVAF